MTDFSSNAVESYTLYQYETCPFCSIVRQFLMAVDFQMPMKDIHKDRDAFLELIQGGGSQTVPCLRIEKIDGVTWMYESRDIIDYLNRRIGVLRD